MLQVTMPRLITEVAISWFRVDRGWYAEELGKPPRPQRLEKLSPRLKMPNKPSLRLERSRPQRTKCRRREMAP